MDDPLVPMTSDDRAAERRHWTDYAMALGTMLAASIAMVAAGLTGWQLYLSERNNARELRAYLITDVDEISGSDNNADNMFVDFHVSNVGQTPAHGVETSVTYAKFPLNRQEVAERVSKQEGVSILGRDRRNPYRLEIKLNAQEVRDLDAKKERIYVYGIVKYTDIYRERHLLRFCRYLRGGLREAQFLHCNHHNAAD